MKLLVTLFLSISIFAFAKGPNVSYGDVRRTMDKMYAYHIDQKKLTPEIVARSIKIYCHQFDSDKLYFLQSEVDDYSFLSDRISNEAMKGYYQDQYPVYIALSHTIDNSIARNRAIRDWVWSEILEGRFDDGKGIDWGHYAQSDDDLARRMHAKASIAFIHYQKRSGVALTEPVKLRLIKRHERKLRRFEAAYYHENERGEILSNAMLEQNVSIHILKSMSKSLDAHSAYYTPDEARELRTALKKQFEGIGIVLRETDDGVVVTDMIAGGPAERSGQIKVGDYLVRVDQKTIHEFSFEEVLDSLKCDHGKLKVLTVKNEKGYEKSVSLRPEKIVLQEERVSYTTEVCRDGIIAKINLPGFYDNGDGITLERDLKQAFKELNQQGKIYGVILDMRTNSGGFLTQAVKVASMFITKGIVVISKYSDGEMRYMRDIDGRLYFQGPMLLLTSKASASAAEILAQALQDYGIALVIGDERTYGKGSMQYQTVTLENTDAFFKVTVG
ncbi:MAG: S41 family peptidase, partial [Simkaniaceae bacterium]|nr:S41 family peptidase [Simkaniaceae bacterium]